MVGIDLPSPDNYPFEIHKPFFEAGFPIIIISILFASNHISAKWEMPVMVKVLKSCITTNSSCLVRCTSNSIP